ncbi:unnamed protein product [Camellia sinensis]
MQPPKYPHDDDDDGPLPSHWMEGLRLRESPLPCILLSVSAHSEKVPKRIFHFIYIYTSPADCILEQLPFIFGCLL